MVPPYKKLQPLISAFIKNSIFGNNRDPWLGLSVLERSQPSTPPPAVVLIPTYPSKVARSRAGCQMKLSHLVRVIADLHPPSLQMVMQQFLEKIAHLYMEQLFWQRRGSSASAASELNQLSCVHVYCPTIEAGKRWGQVSSSKASVTGSNLLTHKVEVLSLQQLLQVDGLLLGRDDCPVRRLPAHAQYTPCFSLFWGRFVIWQFAMEWSQDCDINMSSYRGKAGVNLLLPDRPQAPPCEATCSPWVGVNEI